MVSFDLRSNWRAYYSQRPFRLDGRAHYYEMGLSNERLLHRRISMH